MRNSTNVDVDGRVYDGFTYLEYAWYLYDKLFHILPCTREKLVVGNFRENHAYKTILYSFVEQKGHVYEPFHSHFVHKPMFNDGGQLPYSFYYPVG